MFQEVNVVDDATQATHESHNRGPIAIAGVEIAATVCIVAMWVAVLFDGIYGRDFTSRGAGGDLTIIPSVVFVAFFASLGSAAIARQVFGASRSRAGGRVVERSE